MVKAFKQCFCFGPSMRLYIPYQDIYPFLFPEVRRIEHLVGLSDSCNVTEENLETAPVLLPLFTLYTGKERIGVRAKFVDDVHRYVTLPSERAPYQ